MIRTVCSLFAFAGIVLAQAPTATAPLRPQPAASEGPVVAAMKSSRAIDLVICLDVSGSMNGLINAARQNLWSIVNDMATLKPQPELRVALLTYGSPAYGAETGFVAIQTGLTTDLDLVSQKLFALKTKGGSEYVARVVKRSLDDLKWSSDPHALKLIFVCGNEAATQDPEYNAMEMASTAIGKGVLVNTIYCDNPQKPAADGWRQVARLADGKFAAIEQNQMAVIETPFDKQLMDLSAQLNTTYLTFGSNGKGWAMNQAAQDSNALSLNLAAAAQRCVTKGSKLYYNPSFDLVDAMKNPKFKLTSVKKEELPKELQAMSTVQLQAHVELTSKKRAAIQEQVAEIARQRDAYVLAERKKLAGTGEKMFEEAILESVRAQAASRGFTRIQQPEVAIPTPEPTPAVTPTPKPTPKPGPKPGPKSAGKTKDLVPTAMELRFRKIIADAAKEYQGFARVTGDPKVAPTMCRIPGPYVRVSEASRQHGGKLYLLYARHADGQEYIKESQPAKIGQTLVKESWQRVKGPQKGKTEATARYPFGLTHSDGKWDYHAGDAYGLFVMHKLARDTEGTDQGWIYGTVDRQGKVTAAGKVASCIKCHVKADNDRRFGLQ